MPVSSISVQLIPNRSVTPPKLHDTTHSPIGLWQLNGGLTDSSGNGNDLSVRAGTERYGPAAVPGQQALSLDGSTDLQTAALALFQLTGDVTVEALCFPESDSNNRYVCTCVGDFNSETEVDNHLYGIRLTDGNELSTFLEQDAGSDIPFEPGAGLPIGQWSHVAYVRNGSTHSMYVNGVLAGSSSAVGLPTKGGSPNQRIRVSHGGRPAGTEQWVGLISSLKIMNSALTAAQVLAEAQRTLPDDLRP